MWPRISVRFPLLLSVLVLLPLFTRSQWSSNPAVNTPIVTSAGDQTAPRIIADGVGGYIVSWTGTNGIYAQRLNAAGTRLWPAAGVKITGVANPYDLAADGTGGASFYWITTTSAGNATTVLASKRRVSSSGAVQAISFSRTAFTENTTDYHYAGESVWHDGLGGMVVLALSDWDDETDYNRDAARLDAAGNKTWSITVSSFSMIGGGSWLVASSGGVANGSVFLRQDTDDSFDALGINLMWKGNTSGTWTVPLASGETGEWALIPDASGNTFVSWRLGAWPAPGGSLYVGKVTRTGVKAWNPNVLLAPESMGQPRSARGVTDGLGGVIVCWVDNRSGSHTDIRAQRVNTSGALQWTANGIGVCVYSGNQSSPVMVSDAENGAIIAWTDRRGGNDNIYAQRIDRTGAPLWDPAGVPVCTAAGNQGVPRMVAGGLNAAVAVWQDPRNGNLDIYGSKILPANSVLNPGFEGGLARWTFYTNASGSMTTVTPGNVGTKSARVRLTTKGSNMQAYQSGIPLVAGSQYRLKFKGKSNSGHDVSVGVQRHVAPFAGYGLLDHEVNLTTAWATYSVIFVAAGFTGSVQDGRFRFWYPPYAAAGDEYHLDEVSLERVSPPIAGVPVVTTQPQNATVAIGQTANFTIAATGTAPMTYQWQKNGVKIPGATGLTYTTPPAAKADSGAEFRCQVKNAVGAASSAAAVLNVSTGPANVVQNPGFELGTVGWGFHTDGVASFSTVTPGAVGSKAARVAITTAGTNVQLYQTGIRLEGARSYRLNFRAKSTTAHDVSVSVQRNTSPYTSYGLLNRVFNLTSSWGTFTATFTTSGFAGTTTDTRLKFWLAPYDANGDQYFFDEVSLVKVTTEEPARERGGEGQDVPLEFRLDQNYPNPFNPLTTIGYTIPEQSRVSVRIFNVLGEQVAVLEDGVLAAGSHQVRFDATDRPSGVYFCRIEAIGLGERGEKFARSMKMMLLK